MSQNLRCNILHLRNSALRFRTRDYRALQARVVSAEIVVASTVSPFKHGPRKSTEGDNDERGRACVACDRSDDGESFRVGTIAARFGARQRPDLPWHPRS